MKLYKTKTFWIFMAVIVFTIFFSVGFSDCGKKDDANGGNSSSDDCSKTIASLGIIKKIDFKEISEYAGYSYTVTVDSSSPSSVNLTATFTKGSTTCNMSYVMSSNDSSTYSTLLSGFNYCSFTRNPCPMIAIEGVHELVVSTTDGNSITLFDNVTGHCGGYYVGRVNIGKLYDLISGLIKHEIETKNLKCPEDWATLFSVTEIM